MKSRLRLIVVLLIVIAIVSLSVFAFAETEIFSLFKKFSKPNEKTDGEIVATVNGEEITKKHIDFIVEYKTLSNKNAEQFEKENGLEVKIRTVDREKVIKEEVQKLVVWQETQKQNLVVDFDEAYKQAKVIYENSKSDKNVAEEIESYMKANGMTESEYIELYAKSYQKQLSEQKLYEKIIENAEGSKEECCAEYIKELVKKADIKYYN